MKELLKKTTPYRVFTDQNARADKEQLEAGNKDFVKNLKVLQQARVEVTAHI